MWKLFKTYKDVELISKNEELKEENRVLRDEVYRCHHDIDKLLQDLKDQRTIADRLRDEIKTRQKVCEKLQEQLPVRDKGGRFTKK